MLRLIRLIDGLSYALAVVGAGALFAVGLMLGYEVVARYFFTAPTIWAEELSRVFMIWAVFLGGAYLIRSNDHIRVTVLVERASPRAQAVWRATGLLFVGAIAALVAWNGAPTAINSYETGRATGTLLNLPAWLIQVSIPLGFGLMALQAVATFVRAIIGVPDAAAAAPDLPRVDH